MEDATKLLETLKELKQSDLEEFIWHLRFGVDKDIRIPQGELERAKRQDVVAYMINRFKTNAGKITVEVLSKMNQNYLATCLESKLPEVSEDVSAEGGASSAAAATNASKTGVTQNINTASGGTVKAHVIQGGVYHGPVTFN